MSHAGRVGLIGLTGPAGVEQPSPGGEGGGHVDNVFTGGGQQLGEPMTRRA